MQEAHFPKGAQKSRPLSEGTAFSIYRDSHLRERIGLL